MNSNLVNPLDLPIVPPMDLNASMPGIDRISPYPMQLRTRASVGLFGTRRDADPGLIRLHEGVDLLAPIGTKVFAAATGKVIGGSATSALLLHDNGFRFLTYYQHIQKKTVQTGATVNAGQQIAEVGDFPDSTEDHLHFEIRYPFDAATPSYENSLPVDPTLSLYCWEEKTYQNDDQARLGHLLDNVTIKSIEDIWRARLLRFFLVNVDGDARDLFLPLHEMRPADVSMVETIRSAFLAGKKVRIVWRESQFFKGIQATYARASVIAEVKVYR